jgi:hypothetical protein
VTFAESLARSLIKGAAAFSVTGGILYLNHFAWSDAAAGWGWTLVR